MTCLRSLIQLGISQTMTVLSDDVAHSEEDEEDDDVDVKAVVERMIDAT